MCDDELCTNPAGAVPRAVQDAVVASISSTERAVTAAPDDDRRREAFRARLRLAATRVALRDLPPGTVLHWAHDVVEPRPGVFAGWVDAVVPELCAALGRSWLVSVVDPDGADDDEVGAFDSVVLPHDASVRVGWDCHWGVYDGPAELLDGVRPASFDDSGTTPVVVRPVWTVALVDEVLTFWVRAVSGRDDLSVRFSDQVAEMLAARNAERFGDVPGLADCLELGDGVVCTDVAMDQLLAMGPDAAASLLTKLKASLGQP